MEAVSVEHNKNCDQLNTYCEKARVLFNLQRDKTLWLYPQMTCGDYVHIVNHV